MSLNRFGYSGCIPERALHLTTREAPLHRLKQAPIVAIKATYVLPHASLQSCRLIRLAGEQELKNPISFRPLYMQSEPAPQSAPDDTSGDGVAGSTPSSAQYSLK